MVALSIIISFSDVLVENLRYVQNGDCGYFMWHDEVYEINSNAELDDTTVKLMEKERTISQLLVERKAIEEKLLKQKQKRAKADEFIADMKEELALMRIKCGKHEKGEKFFATALAMSWIMFGVLLCVAMAM